MTSLPSAAPALVRLSATEIARQIQAGDLGAVEVVEAFIARIETTQRQLGAVVARRFEQARKAAVAIDRARQAGQPLGPLAGVPITVKECFDVAGTAATLGVAHRQQLAAADSPLVAALQAAGAIVLGKTNVPQLMIYFESDNPLFGRTNNPWRLDRACGGSSGGEAASVAAGCSALGLASDLGGSIRQPAHSCGVHGLKPTAGRLTNAGCAMTFRGMNAVALQPGPIARSVDDLSLAMRILTSPNVPRDLAAALPAWPDDRRVEIAGLRIAQWTDDGYFSPSPAIRRAVQEAGEALRAAGATVEPFTPPDVTECMAIYSGLLGADGGRDFRRLLGASPADWRLWRLLRLASVPRAARGAISAGLNLLGQHRRATLVRQTGPLSAHAFWQLVQRRDRYIATFMTHLAAGRFDAMIFPTFGVPAIRHGTSLELIVAGSYCFLPNLLGIPAGTVAATRVRPGEESDRPVSRDPSDIAARAAETDSTGLPVGVQVAAGHWREDIVLAVMRTLERHFAIQADYPAFPPI